MPAALAALLPVTTEGASETEALGARIAPLLAAGDVLLLYGDLGAGKTHLVRGLVAGFGGDPETVTSPTFTLVHAYATAGPRVVHIDAYRLDGPDAFRRIGGDELLDDAEAVTIVEWPERLEGLLPDHALAFTLAHEGGDRRTIRHRRPEEGTRPS